MLKKSRTAITTTSRWASEGMASRDRFALIANPDSPRASGFVAACRTQDFPEPVVLPWEEVLEPGYDFAGGLVGTSAVRIETPAGHPQVERLLLAIGARVLRFHGALVEAAESDCLVLPDDTGELRLQPQWYAGWRQTLFWISHECGEQALCLMNSALEIATLFDKHATRSVLAEAGIPIPPDAGICDGFDHLIARMDEKRWDRVFLKPCYGSSAAGVMAISRAKGGRWQAVTSAKVDTSTGSPRILNSKRPLRLNDPEEIRRTVDLVCSQQALVERWFPKASVGGRVFDLRILVIAGRAAHIAVRTSHSPVTNLHLRNRRGDVEQVIEHIGREAWQIAIETAEAAAACFPGCHYCGVDLMIGARSFRSAVAEVNAFGDHLHHELWQGMNPWEAELALWPGR